MRQPLDVLDEADIPAAHGEAVAPVALKPPLKWAGGKRWQVPHLRVYWAAHAHRRLVEPFCGGLAVTMGLTPKRALLNDVNPHVVNFYRWIQRGLTIADSMSNSKRRYTPAFARWEFTNTTFDEVPLEPDDFVYADPPYDVEFTLSSRVSRRAAPDKPHGRSHSRH